MKFIALLYISCVVFFVLNLSVLNLTYSFSFYLTKSITFCFGLKYTYVLAPESATIECPFSFATCSTASFAFLIIGFNNSSFCF